MEEWNTSISLRYNNTHSLIEIISPAYMIIYSVNLTAIYSATYSSSTKGLPLLGSQDIYVYNQTWCNPEAAYIKLYYCGGSTVSMVRKSILWPPNHIHTVQVCKQPKKPHSSFLAIGLHYLFH